MAEWLRGTAETLQPLGEIFAIIYDRAYNKRTSKPLFLKTSWVLDALPRCAKSAIETKVARVSTYRSE